MISLLMAWALLALSVSEWLALASLIVGSSLIANFTLGVKALQKIRQEKKDAPAREQVVVWTEVEATFQMMHSTIEQQGDDLRECRDHLAEARAWRRDHIAQCPQWAGGRNGR